MSSAMDYRIAKSLTRLHSDSPVPSLIAAIRGGTWTGCIHSSPVEGVEEKRKKGGERKNIE